MADPTEDPWGAAFSAVSNTAEGLGTDPGSQAPASQPTPEEPVSKRRGKPAAKPRAVKAKPKAPARRPAAKATPGKSGPARPAPPVQIGVPTGKAIRKKPKGRLELAQWRLEQGVATDGSNDSHIKAKKVSSRWDTFDVPGVPKDEKAPTKTDRKAARKIDNIQASKSFRQLARLLAVNRTEIIPLTRVATQYKGTPLGTAYAKMRTDMADRNASFATAFARNGRVFPRVVNGLVTIGAQAGKEIDALNRAAVIIRDNAKVGRRIRTAVSEPMFTLVLTILFLFVVLFGIIPSFQAVFTSLGKPLPLISVILQYFSYTLGTILILIVIGVIVWWLYWRAKGKYNEDLRVWLDTKALHLKPKVLGELLQTGQMSQLFSNLATLRAINMSERNALITAARSSTNWAIRKSLLIHAARLESGEATFGDLASDPLLFPPDASYMLKVGEDSGKGTQTLNEMAEDYKEESDLSADQFVAQVGPIVNAIVGAIYMFVMLASYLPIFSIYTAISS